MTAVAVKGSGKQPGVKERKAKRGFSLSVGARIAILALIPVVGFLANGTSFISGERQVASSFASVTQAGAVAQASLELKGALTSMRNSAKDFAAQPNALLAAEFDKGYKTARDAVTRIEEASDASEVKNVRALHEQLDSLKQRFASLGAEQEQFGLSETQGVRGQIRSTGIAIDRAVNEGLPAFPEAERGKLFYALLSMRRSEAEYRLNRVDYLLQVFKSNLESLKEQLAASQAPDAPKEELARAAQAYADAFAAWSARAEKVNPLLAVIQVDSNIMLPTVDRLIEAARGQVAVASQELASSQNQTKLMIVTVGTAVVMLGLVFSWWIGRNISRPIARLNNAMGQLAQGAHNIEIPGTAAKDEIGAMARTVQVFRDGLIERQRLLGQTEAEQLERAARQERLLQRIAGFESMVQQLLDQVNGRIDQMRKVSKMLTEVASETTSRATSAATASQQASSNVEHVSSAAEELAASISSIARQVTTLNDTAAKAANSASATNKRVEALSIASQKIGDVVELIRGIAEQTNLLALNATIEASRAGEAGRGFGVVAAEVKTLAGQTAKATDEIAEQINAIRASTVDAVQAMAEITATMSEVNRVAAEISAAVSEQEATTSEISRSMHEASAGTRNVEQDLSTVSEAASRTNHAAGETDNVSSDVAQQANALRQTIDGFLKEVAAA